MPPDKYKVLGDVLDWATNVGYPGYATAAIDEVFNTFVIPTMFAKAARDELTPGGRGAGGREGDQADLRQVEVDRGAMAPWPSSRRAG